MSPGYGHDERDDCGHACDFSRAVDSASSQIAALTESIKSFETAATQSSASLEDLLSEKEQLMKQEKNGLSERQIQKTMRLRGVR